MNILRALLVVVVALASACRHGHGGIEVQADPNVKWAPATTTCEGAPAVADGYNVYVVQGAGPVPTVAVPPSELPCAPLAVVDTTKVQPLNGTTLVPNAACTGTPAVCTYHTDLPKGTYTVVVEAVLMGSQSGPSNAITFSVVPRLNAPTAVQVTK